MALWQHIQPLFLISGFGVGFLVGLTGMGGGSLMTPLLILLFGVHPSAAVGTDLIYASATKACGSVVHGWHRNIHWPLVGRLALGSLPASGLMLLLLRYLPGGAAAVSSLISHVLAGALVLTALSILFRRRLLDRFGPRLQALGEPAVARLTVVTGAVVGVLVTLSSVGAGALGGSALLLFYPRLPMAKVVGSDIAHAVPLTLIAGAGHLAVAPVSLGMLASLLLGSLPGIAIASHLAPRLPERALQYGLAAVLTLVSIRLIA